MHARWISHLPYATTVKAAHLKFLATKNSFSKFWEVLRRQVTALLLTAMASPGGEQFRHVLQHMNDMHDAVKRFVMPIQQDQTKSEADVWRMMSVLCQLNEIVARKQPKDPYARIRWNSPLFAHKVGEMQRDDLFMARTLDTLCEEGQAELLGRKSVRANRLPASAPSNALPGVDKKANRSKLVCYGCKRPGHGVMRCEATPQHLRSVLFRNKGRLPRTTSKKASMPAPPIPMYAPFHGQQGQMPAPMYQQQYALREPVPVQQQLPPTNQQRADNATLVQQHPATVQQGQQPAHQHLQHPERAQTNARAGKGRPSPKKPRLHGPGAHFYRHTAQGWVLKPQFHHFIVCRAFERDECQLERSQCRSPHFCTRCFSCSHPAARCPGEAQAITY
jgi:hypothetical protein